MTDSKPPLIIWRLLDGKRGHENQSLGLQKALEKKLDCQCFEIAVHGIAGILFLFNTSASNIALPKPDILLGAGHATHIHLLNARRLYGGKIIVLMKPSLPCSWFDLCLIPEHDNYRDDDKILITQGVLNSINPAGNHFPEKALIMIGGPSSHFAWDSEKLLTQIKLLLEDNNYLQFVITTSRRTPLEFASELKDLKATNLRIVPVQETEPDWVARQLADSATAWITEDSVSMIYEALTASVAVGILSMPIKHTGRVTIGIENLSNLGLVSRFDFQGNYKNTLKPAAGFFEADRCAEWIANTWLEQDKLIEEY